MPLSRPEAGLLLLPLVPLLALPLLALPQAEDFCWGLAGRAQGLLGGVAALYDSWGGRLLPHGLMILPTTLADATGLPLLWIYRLLLILALAGLAAFLCWVARRLAAQQAGQSWPVLAVLLLYMLVAGARAPRDLLAWWPSVVTYVPAGCASLAVYLLLLQPESRGRTWSALIAATVAGLSVEFGPLLTLLALGAALPQRPERWRLALAIAVIALAALVLLALSPGNEVRGFNDERANYVGRALWMGPVLVLEFYGQNLANPAVLGALSLVLWCAARAARARPPAPAAGASPWWPFLLAFLGAVAALSLGVWATGGGLPARSENALLLFSLPLLALALILLARRLPTSLLRLLSARGLGIVATLYLLLGPLPWHGFADLEEAWRFAGAGAARLGLLESTPGGAAVEVAPLPAYPLLLTQEELSADPGYWVNRCVADYYGLASVRLAGPGPDFLAATQPFWFAWPW